VNRSPPKGILDPVRHLPLGELEHDALGDVLRVGGDIRLLGARDRVGALVDLAIHALAEVDVRNAHAAPFFLSTIGPGSDTRLVQ